MKRLVFKQLNNIGNLLAKLTSEREWKTKLTISKIKKREKHQNRVQ